MSGYPVIFDLTGRLVLVVGGGTIGRRKVAGLLAAGARVRLVSRDPLPPSCGHGQVEYYQRPFRSDDLAGATLAFAATGIAEVDRAVLDAARTRNIPANLAAEPQAGDFILPAVLRRGDLLMAVATGGRAPALAAAIRDRLASGFGPEWALVTALAAGLRTEKLTVSGETAYSHKVLVELLEAGLAELLARGDEAAVNHLLTRVCGREITLAGLGLKLPDRMP